VQVGGQKGGGATERRHGPSEHNTDEDDGQQAGPGTLFTFLSLLVLLIFLFLFILNVAAHKVNR